MRRTSRKSNTNTQVVHYKEFYTLPVFSAEGVKWEYLTSVLWKIFFISKETWLSKHLPRTGTILPYTNYSPRERAKDLNGNDFFFFFLVWLGLFHLGTCPDSVGQRFNELLMQLWLNGLLGTLKCPSVFVFVLCF